MRKRVRKQAQVEYLTSSVGEAAMVSPEQHHATDETGSTSVEKYHHYLEAMIANTSDAMIALDQDFHILDLNPAAIASLGRSLAR